MKSIKKPAASKLSQTEKKKGVANEKSKSSSWNSKEDKDFAINKVKGPMNKR